MAKRPVRKKLPHGVEHRHIGVSIVFVTLCVERRAAVLANASTHSLLTDVWRDATAWLVGRYILMPDHVHFFVAPNHEVLSLEAWMRFWKSQFTKRWTSEGAKKLIRWQTDHWDTRLRREESYAEKWDYVRNNPVRQGLVRRSEDWPWQGVLNELRWN